MRLCFVCSADERFGFGHAARCLRLASLLADRLPGLSVTFQGSYSPRARRRIGRNLPGVRFCAEDDGRAIDATVCVFDRLGHPDELDSHPERLIELAAGAGRRIVYLCSGTSRPPLPADAVSIGYQPGGPAPQPPRRLWGLEYAPVALPREERTSGERAPGRLLIALGGHTDDRPLRLALAAAARLPGIEHIDVLLSPVQEPGHALASCGRRVRVHEDIGNVFPLLRGAELVLASYGNLGFEALAAGAAVCFLGQKPFQAHLAARLATLGLAVDSGLAEEIDADRLASAMEVTRRRAADLSSRARRAIDGRGLERIARVIAQTADAA